MGEMGEKVGREMVVSGKPFTSSTPINPPITL